MSVPDEQKSPLPVDPPPCNPSPVPSTLNPPDLSTLNPQLSTSPPSPTHVTHVTHVTPVTVSAAWEQQPKESLKAFGAFRAYLALGPDRSLVKLAAATNRDRRQLAHWSATWGWTARAAAYTAHLEQVERQTSESLVRQKSVDWVRYHESVRQQAWKQAEDLIAMAEQFKERWRNTDRLPDFGAVIRALDLAFKLKQFAAGMPSEIKAVNTTVSGFDGGPVRVEFDAALKKIYGRPLPGEVVDVQSSPAPLSQPLSAVLPADANPPAPSSPPVQASPSSSTCNLQPATCNPSPSPTHVTHGTHVTPVTPVPPSPLP